jgi:hypothetical protein
MFLTLLVQQRVDDECKVDLIIHYRLLKPAEHWYKQLECRVMSLISDYNVGMPTMIDRCYQHYTDCPAELASIRRFMKLYRSVDAAYWFTKDTFLYRFVSKTLRLGNIEWFHNMRFYIAHLSTQLAELRCKQKEYIKGVNIVYRGLRQSIQELETLKKLIGSVIVTKGFMSTSWDKRVALFYAGANQPQNAESQPLVLELMINFRSPFVVAADISHLSNFPDEREVLVDIGTEFRVETLRFDSSNSIWLCQLSTLAEAPSPTRPPSIIFCEIFTTKLDTYTTKEAAVDKEMQYQRRHKFDPHTTRPKQNELWRTRRTLPWIADGPIELARVWQQKGLRSWQQRDFHQAKTCLENAAILYEYEQKAVDQNELACCFAQFGFLLYTIGEHTRAIDIMERSLSMSLQLATLEHLILARHYRIMGLAYLAVERIEDALMYHSQALIIDEKVRPTAKWSMALTLRNFALIYRSRGNKAQAAQYFMKAWHTFSEVLTNLQESH